MKKLILLCFASSTALFSFATIRVSEPAPTSDSAYIYIYRVGQFSGALANFSIFVDGEKLCKISNNKYFKIPVSKGVHNISAKVGGIGVFKKETELEVEADKTGNYYVACSMKQSITRVRLEMIEVTKKSGENQMAKMTEDKCQEHIDQND